MKWLMLACVVAGASHSQGAMGLAPAPRSASGAKEETDLLDRRVVSLELKGVSLRVAIRQIRRMGVRVCVERRRKAKEDPKISLSCSGCTVRVMMDCLVAQAPAYAWRRYRKTDLLLIQPKKGSVLTWQVPRLDVRRRSPLDILERGDDLGLTSHGILVFERGIDIGLRKAWSYRLPEQTAVDSLCDLIEPIPHVCWDLLPCDKNKWTLTFSQAMSREDFRRMIEESTRNGKR